jgi:hypothetical protein
LIDLFKCLEIPKRAINRQRYNICLRVYIIMLGFKGLQRVKLLLYSW